MTDEQLEQIAAQRELARRKLLQEESTPAIEAEVVSEATNQCAT
jgi:hypothetical protein